MNLLLWIVFGVLVGWIASLIMGTSQRQGLLGNILLGVLGSLLGGFVMTLFGQPGVTGFDFYSIAVGIAGAILLILLGRVLTRST